MIISPLFSSTVSFPPLWADDYSNKKHLRLQITTVIQTPALPQLSVVVVYWAVLLCLSCISPPQVRSCLWVTWWPRRDPQPRSHWWFGDLAGKAVAQLFVSVGGGAACHCHSYKLKQLTHLPVLFYCTATSFPFPAVFLVKVTCDVQLTFVFVMYLDVAQSCGGFSPGNCSWQQSHSVKE